MAKEAPKTLKETAVFKYDQEKLEIIGLSDKLPDFAKFRYASVTTDQPVYWPNETVNLKVMLPALPDAEVTATVQKKDAAPSQPVKIALGGNGMAVEKIMDGSGKKLEIGEYRVEVKTTDGKITDSASFSVVDGHLGAVSFAYEFDQLTSAEALREARGGWFLGNASGAGKRWGNGLNVKNEVRVLNQPYDGPATVRSRCYLPGCNGCEAGAPREIKIEKGLLETFMDVGGHSGPFELEVVTPKGDARNLFGRSGHVERQTTLITSGMTTAYYATLAPYENTRAVPGREIYIEKKGTNGDDALELESPVSSMDGKAVIKVKKALANPKAFIYYPTASGAFETAEVPLGRSLEPGMKIEPECRSPFSFIAVAGFIENPAKDERKEKEKPARKYFEAWAIVFTPSPVDIDLKAPESALPLSECAVTIRTSDRRTGAPAQMNGILEVFDNRVASRSAREPLVSCIGDSYRMLSDNISSWRDWTGIEESLDEDNVSRGGKSMFDGVATNYSPSPVPAAPMMTAPMQSKGKMAAPPKPSVAIGFLADKQAISTNAPGDAPPAAIREGEKKVVYCAVVRTGKNGEAVVKVKLPPQTGRCKARFVAAAGFDYNEKVAELDVTKKCFIEASIPQVLTPGSRVRASVTVVNSASEKATLRVSGACLEKAVEKEVPAGSSEHAFELVGRDFGKLAVEISRGGGETDRREFTIRGIDSIPVTFSSVVVSDGSKIVVPAGRRAAVYANPARMLQGAAANMETTMRSWFGNAEALAASVAIRATLLRAIADGVMGDDGMRDRIAGELSKSVKDLEEKFIDGTTGLVFPYPGMPASERWTVWAARDLLSAQRTLSGNAGLKAEFARTLDGIAAMLEKMIMALSKKGVSISEAAMYDEKSGASLLPVEVDGKIVHRGVTDDAVIDFFVKKALPSLDVESPEFARRLSANFAKLYDIHRFLRAFERTGGYNYMMAGAEGLLARNDPAFSKVFNAVARGMIATAEPGIIQGPALLGGVYSAPRTMVRFLDLLVAMASSKRAAAEARITLSGGPQGRETIVVSDAAHAFETAGGPVTVEAPEFAVVRIDETRDFNIFDHLEKESFFTVKASREKMKTGDESIIAFTLGDNILKGSDPADYYAIAALPATLSLMQTEDLLADYRGQLIYGQKASGGERISFVTAPFRGSKTIEFKVKAAMPGSSEGFVTVRRLSDPSFAVTVKTSVITVE